MSASCIISHTLYHIIIIIIINRRYWLQNATDTPFKKQQLSKNFGSFAMTVQKEICIVLVNFGMPNIFHFIDY